MKHMAELLLEDTYYTVGVIFSDERDWEKAKDCNRQYTYKVSNDLKLEAGDIVIVMANGKLQFVRVVAIHENEIDYESNFVYTWVIQKVDLQMYKALIARDKDVKEVVKETEKAKKKTEMLDLFKSNLDDKTLQLFDDKIKQIGISK